MYLLRCCGPCFKYPSLFLHLCSPRNKQGFCQRSWHFAESSARRKIVGMCHQPHRDKQRVFTVRTSFRSYRIVPSALLNPACIGSLAGIVTLSGLESYFIAIYCLGDARNTIQGRESSYSQSIQIAYLVRLIQNRAIHDRMACLRRQGTVRN